MPSHLVAPREKRLELENGEYLIVKERLNAGETIDMFERGAPSVDLTVPGAAHRIRATTMGSAIITAYLLDWSFTDDDGVVMPIRGLSTDEKDAAVKALEFDDYIAIMNAITTHDAAQRSKKKLGALATA